jgi:deazaflavin-dependent oxidoreductase (nitroreductase family)
MTSNSAGSAAAAPGVREPVAPSPFVRTVMRPMTKKLNPVIGRFAGRKNFHMAAELRHIGRRSGKPYVTPVSARLIGGVAIVPLTFGNQSDWARNVYAAGGCVIRLDGLDYVATDPEFVSRSQAKPQLRTAFNPAQRVMLRMLGIKQFMRLQVSPVSD